MADIRKCKLNLYNPGGNARGNAQGCKLTIPIIWIKELGLNENNRYVNIEFDGEKIVITPEKKQLIFDSLEEFAKFYSEKKIDA